MLRTDLEDRYGFNVSDFFAQLHRRTPLVPVQRDDGRSYIPDTFSVCFLDHFPAPQSAYGVSASTEEYTDLPEQAGVNLPTSSSKLNRKT